MLVTQPTSPAAQPERRWALLDGLTDDQRRAVETGSTTVCVLAAAGAGKTRVLTRRIAFRILGGTAKAGHVLAITFTRKAAGELRERLRALDLGEDVAAGTFHAAAWAQLRRYWADRRLPELPLMQRKGALLAELAAGRPGLASVSIADLAVQIEWAKARMVAPGQFAQAARDAQRELPADGEALASLYARYEDEKRRRRVVDFDDLLARYADALSSDRRFAAAQRWKWRHVFVDELQDVNPLQHHLLMTILGGQNDDLFVVGDPHQAIYGWNGADPTFLSKFPESWPGAEVVRLDDNHRSSPQVVAAATAVLGRQSSGQVRSSRPDGPMPALRCYASDEAEAAGVSAEIRAAQARGIPWREMAVLARTNAQLGPLAVALGRAGVPCHGLAAPDGPEATTETVAANAAGPEDAVSLSTFHRAKGLQWQAVWACGLESGLVPIAYASSPAALAEERRLLYVALSRTQSELRCSWARERKLASGMALRREPSPWLTALAPFCATTDEPPALLTTSGDGRARDPGEAPLIDFLATARRRLSQGERRAGAVGRAWALSALADEGEADGTLTTDALATAERLREWRRRWARASGVPPYVLLHDSTLEIIAARRPASAQELLGVPGLGPIKVARFGAAILEVLRGAGPKEVPEEVGVGSSR